MVALSGNRIAWTYTADDGTEYRVAAQKALTDQEKLGGSAAASSVPQKPASIKMRRITVSDGSGNARVVPVYEPGATICTVGTTINVNILGTSTSCTSHGNPIPENHIRRNVTTQSA